MLRWCAYCQRFQGEVAPLTIFTTTHGICPACLAKGMPQLDREIQESHRIRAIQGLLYEAGKTGDIAAAAVLIQFAKAAALRPLDILIGLITPLLYRIGDEWETGKITIADQQRFSRFCERVYELIKLDVHPDTPIHAADHQARVLLFNVPGNDHNLGIRILDLWLHSKGIDSREFRPPTQETLVDLVEKHRPRAILVSLSMASQAANLTNIAQRIDRLPDHDPGSSSAATQSRTTSSRPP
jgi:methanogenic corrinoid protein MtbC1